jgi:transcriptional regulator with XRE-family HTH domain
MTVKTKSDVVAARIRAIRKERGLTPGDLAALCASAGASHLTENVIENIESGRRDKEGRRRRDVSVDELFVLAAALGEPVELLLYEQPPATTAVQLQRLHAIERQADQQLSSVRGLIREIGEGMPGRLPDGALIAASRPVTREEPSDGER